MLVIAESQFPDNSGGSGHIYTIICTAGPNHSGSISFLPMGTKFVSSNPESSQSFPTTSKKNPNNSFERPHTPALYHNSHFPEFVDIEFGLPADSYHVAAKY